MTKKSIFIGTKKVLGIYFAVFLSLAIAFACAVYFGKIEEGNKVEASSEEKVDALFIFSTDSTEAMNVAIEKIEELNGKVVHKFPTHVAFGEFAKADKDKVLEINGVDKIYFDEVNVKDFEPYGKDAYVGTMVWNNLFKSDGNSSINEVDAADFGKDALEVPLGMEEYRDKLDSAPVATGAPDGAGFYDTSEYMAGDVSVAIILPESNGAIDTSSENWTTAREAQVVAEVQAGLNWWANRESAANLSFTYHSYLPSDNSKVQTSYEPINRSADPSGTTGEALWVQEIMGNFGYTNSSWFDRVRQFNGDIRNADGTDWGITFFVVDSANDADGYFADSYFAYAWIGGPYSVMTYDNDNYGIANMDAVAAHESGHLFYANDQYASSGCLCTWHRGYLDYQNQNCDNSCLINESSIMRGQVAPYTGGNLDSYAKGQIGMVDSDGDGVINILDVKPSVSVNKPKSPTKDRTPKIEGSAHVNKTNNQNPSGQSNDISIDKINTVEYKVDSGSWRNASASDGDFDEASENYNFKHSLSLGRHTIKVRSKTDEGLYSNESSVSIQIGTPEIVTIPGYTGSPQARRFTDKGVAKGGDFFAFPKWLREGGRIATGDVDKDGESEIIAGSGMGDQAHVVVYEKNGVKRGIDFRPFPGEYGGVDVAAGDFNGDGKDEVVAANFTGSNSKIIVYKYNTAREIYATVTPFGSASVGATVAAGDVDKDGKAELIVGASVGGAPRVIVYDVKKNKMIKKPIEFMAFAPSSRSGVDVSSGDFDNDGKDEIVVSQLFYAEARVKVYRYNSQKTILGNFLAYPAGIQCGANVDAFDIDSDDKAEVLTGPNMPGAAQIRAFEKNGTSLANVNFFAYARSLKSGASVVGGWF